MAVLKSLKLPARATTREVTITRAGQVRVSKAAIYRNAVARARKRAAEAAAAPPAPNGSAKD